MSALKVIRYGAWFVVALLVFAVASLSIGYFKDMSSNDVTKQVAAIGGPFELIDGRTGKTVTEADFTGKPTLIFFGFTFCPDVCPTTLSEMQGWIDDLGPEADQLNYAFVTVDPERDTPEKIANYVSAFDDKIAPLSGSREQVDEILKAYRVYAKKVPLEGDDYTMDHSASVYIMDADNKFFGTIAYGESHENAMAKLRRLIENAKG